MTLSKKKINNFFDQFLNTFIHITVKKNNLVVIFKYFYS